MSSHRLLKFGAPLLALLLAWPLAGCMRQAPLKNLLNQPVTGAAGGGLSSDQVKRAILAACQKREWVARELSPGVISATLDVRNKHSAQVEIPYTGASYSINYKNSSGLKYNAQNGTIHNQYNNWVLYLRQDIDAALAQL